jgi:FkbM family methyltransferase
MSLKKGIQKFARRFGCDIRSVPRVLARRPEAQLTVSLEMVLAKRFVEVDDFYFVQIGAFDGICVDPITRMLARLRCRGLMIEPHPGAFAQLTTNMAGRPNLELLQVAVSDTEGQLPFYCVDPAAPGAPTKAPLLSSLSRKKVLEELDPALDWNPWIREIRVLCVTLNSLLAGRNIPRLDLLQIDAEGHDGRILRSLDFTRWKPAIIHYEHARLSPEEMDVCWRELIRLGYRLHVSSPDTLAVHGSAV